MKKSSIIFLLFISSLCSASDITENTIIDVLYNNVSLYSDSGNKLSKRQISNCISQQRPSYFVVNCSDLLFQYNISIFDNSYILITQSGASVENRWLFNSNIHNTNIFDKIWPTIDNSTISEILISKTGDNKYTTPFINQVSHSKYRISHTSSNMLTLTSGIPDKSEGISIGKVEWNGKQFVFKRDDS